MGSDLATGEQHTGVGFLGRMSSALGYYATQKRASERLENKRNEISRASAYILDSGSSRTGSNNYSSSYSSNSTSNNYSSDVGRAGRGRYRDSSTDYSAKLSRRSSSLEIGAVKLRNRDVSTDLSYKRDFSSSSTRPSRPVTRNYDGEEHSDEYKKIMSSSDKYLTMAKYSSSNGEAKEVNSMMEEERSKAYSKIIGAQTAQSLVSGNQELKKIQQSC